MAFVDLAKVLDTVYRELIWNSLRTIGYPPTSMIILQQFQSDMCAQMIMTGSHSFMTGSHSFMTGSHSFMTGSHSLRFPAVAGGKEGCVIITASRLQRSFDVTPVTYIRVGLIVNSTKTQILSVSLPHASTISIGGNHHKNI